MRIDLGDVDTDELDAAADYIDALVEAAQDAVNSYNHSEEEAGVQQAIDALAAALVGGARE